MKRKTNFLVMDHEDITTIMRIVVIHVIRYMDYGVKT